MNHGCCRTFMASIVLCLVALTGYSQADILKKLGSKQDYSASATVTVSLPGVDREMVYEVNLMSSPSQDTLCPVNYLTDWKAQTPAGQIEGFAAYIPGSHYRFRDKRLQEYHWEQDSIPLITGIQNQAQFVNLLPAMMAKELTELSLHPYTTVTAEGDTIIKVITALDEVIAADKEYHFDAMGNPTKIMIESNPGQVAEQTTYITFHPSRRQPQVLTEDVLSEMFPEAFGKYRESNFAIENLIGEQLPTFSLPTATGERYTYHKGETFRAPTIIAILNPEDEFTTEAVSDLRQAIQHSPFNSDLIFAMTTTNIDAAEQPVNYSLNQGEHLLINARQLVRTLGAASLPAFVILSPDGKIADVIKGYNKNLSELVIQRLLLLNN